MIISTIQKFLQIFGFQVSRTPEEKRKIEFRWLNNLHVKTVIDIGANTGQSIEIYKQLCPEAMIYSFEPLSDCYEQLISKVKGDSGVQCFNIALSNKSGTVLFNRNQFSAASSFLDINEVHKSNYPSTAGKIIKEEVKTERLDDFAKNLNLVEPIVIKIDVQGAEDQVIEGGGEIFRKAKVVIIEISIEHLYKDQPLFDDIYHILKNLGFSYYGNSSQSHSVSDGHVLFIDAIFVKL
jgi:FkbM family methyltransferase